MVKSEQRSALAVEETQRVLDAVPVEVGIVGTDELGSRSATNM
jgi:hypothetical protein